MKHLKKFNESNSIENLKDFCENCLAYLLDDGEYELFVDDYPSHFRILFCEKDLVKKWFEENRSHIEWNNIKDRFIPFLTLLNKNYNIITEIEFSSKEYLVSDILSDQFEDIYNKNPLSAIKIFIRK